MKASLKLMVSFCVAAVFLLAVEIAGVAVIDRVVVDLNEIKFDNNQEAMVAEAIHSWHVAPQRLADHEAQFSDLEHLAHSEEERKWIYTARAQMKAQQPADLIVDQLEQMAAFYRSRAGTNQQKILAFQQRILAGLAAVMFATVLLFVILSSLLRKWILMPLGIITTGAIGVAEGKLDRKVSLIGGEEFVQTGRAINQMADQIHALKTESEGNQRLVKVGEACSHVTHNVRSLLGSIRSLAQYESNASDVEPNSRIGFNYIIALVNKLDTWVRDVHSTLAPMQTNRATHHIEPIVHDILQLLEPRISEKGLDVQYQEADGLPRVLIDRALFEQAFVAIMTNAIEAAPDNSRVGVSLRNGSSDNLTIVIEDAGAGMADETKKHVFDAFFTTKPERAGLGLTIAQSILKRHGGEIEIDTAPNKGTRILMSLPAAKKS